MFGIGNFFYKTIMIMIWLRVPYHKSDKVFLGYFCYYVTHAQIMILSLLIAHPQSVFTKLNTKLLRLLFGCGALPQKRSGIFMLVLGAMAHLLK